MSGLPRSFRIKWSEVRDFCIDKPALWPSVLLITVWLTKFMTWINNYIRRYIWDVINHLCHNINGGFSMDGWLYPIIIYIYVYMLFNIQALNSVTVKLILIHEVGHLCRELSNDECVPYHITQTHHWAAITGMPITNIFIFSNELSLSLITNEYETHTSKYLRNYNLYNILSCHLKTATRGLTAWGHQLDEPTGFSGGLER